jgi:hypothetical protein
MGVRRMLLRLMVVTGLVIGFLAVWTTPSGA